MTAPDFCTLPDLALRSLGGAVVWANDESFAEKENLILPGDPGHRPATFGPRGQIYDGWETRRRRAPGSDEAIVRLGVPGVVRGIVVDTAWFTGNHPTEITLHATTHDGHPSPDDLIKADWHLLVERSTVAGDTRTHFAVNSETRWTHVKLAIHPDGGVARLRVHGEGRPNRALLDPRSLDLAALENGALVTACSNGYYGSPQNLLFPGPVRTMGEGWETSRRRDDGNDWVEVRLAGTGLVRLIELDTSYFLGNAPGAASVRGRRSDGAWYDLIPRTELQPDTRHRFLVDAPEPVTDIRLDIHPDGGMARLRVHGALVDDGSAR